MKSDDNNVYALSIADAMAAMMLVFILVLLFLMMQQTNTTEQIQENHRLQRRIIEVETRNQQEAGQYFSMKKRIYDALVAEFSGDLKKWNARIDQGTLAFILENSKNGFAPGSADIPDEFKAMLNQFVPRYINVVNKYRDNVSEIRIEGHTSSEWSANSLAECLDTGGENCKKSVYLKNMKLSQDRAMAVLNHILLMNTINDPGWVRSKLTANGLSSSHLLCGTDKSLCSGKPGEQENREASRRVEFSVKTDAESKIEAMLKANGGDASAPPSK